jgi:CheY-like chemotaxis protein
LRRVTTQTLTRTGYRVTAAEEGLYAWEALQKKFSHITPYRHWGINE